MTSNRSIDLSEYDGAAEQDGIARRGRRISELSHTINDLGNLHTELAHASFVLRTLGFKDESDAVRRIGQAVFDRGEEAGDEHEAAIRELDAYVGVLVGAHAPTHAAEVTS